MSQAPLGSRKRPSEVAGDGGFLHTDGRRLAWIAAAFWLAAGLLVGFRGMSILIALDSPVSLGLVILGSLILGLLKGQTVIRSVSVGNSHRLLEQRQSASVASIFTLRIWLVIVFFSLVGVAVRLSPLPDSVRATILLGVGIALLLGGYYACRAIRKV